jgi:ribosomal protein L37AE/L43A
LVSFLGRRSKTSYEQPRECPECPECGSALLRPLEDTHLVCSWCERMWSALDE